MLNRLSCFLSLSLVAILVLGGLGAASDQVKKDEPLKLDTFLVSVQVTVIDSYERNITGLKAENFEVYDNGVKQEVSHFSDAAAPIRLGIVFDTTGSMAEKARHAKTAIGRLLKSGHEEDRSFLICMKDGKAFLSHDYTFNADDIINSLSFVETKGLTALYDSIYLAIEKVQEGRREREDKEKMAIVVISDGQDNNSRYSYGELKDRIREAGVLIYCIGILKPGEELEGYGRANLEELARISGGRAFFPPFAYLKDPIPDLTDNGLLPELTDICWRIAIELRNQYSIGYYPGKLKHDGKWHDIKIKIVNAPKGMPRMKLQYRNKYQDRKE